MFLFEAGGECGQLRLRGIERDAGFEARGHVHETAVAGAVVAVRIDVEGTPEFRVDVEPLESLGHHADDAETLAVEFHGASQDARVGAHPALPKAMAENDHLPAGFSLRVGEGAAEHRCDTQKGKEVGSDELAAISSGSPIPVRLERALSIAAMDSKAVVRDCQSRKSAGETTLWNWRRLGKVSQM